MKTKKINQKHLFQRVLRGNAAVRGVFPGKRELIRFLEEKRESDTPVSVFYGETVDQYGMTMDSLKYYFSVSLFVRFLKEMGVSATGTILVADDASVLNRSVGDKDAVRNEARKRVDEITRIKSLYALPIDIVSMSDLVVTTQYLRIQPLVAQYIERDTGMRRTLEKTVLKNRLRQEREAGFRYATDEVMVSLLFDIKVGPPRERFYDRVTRYVGEKTGLRETFGMYLTPTYPMGVGYPFFISNPEIEQYGLTPYKAGSNKLNENRILVTKTPVEHIKTLIDTSFVPSDPRCANPVFDVYTIAEMARMLGGGAVGTMNISNAYRFDETSMKQRVFEQMMKYVIEPVRRRGI